jgi:hypothetical protein
MSDRSTEAGQPPPPQYPPPQYPPPAPPPMGEQAAGAQVSAPSQSLLERAKTNDREALETMFAQFLPPGETIVNCQYLGVLGLWGIGTHSFAAVTQRRAATLRISLLGGIDYQEGALEYVNSAQVHQPSKVSLYLGVARYLVAALIISIFIGVGTHWALSLLGIVVALLAVPLYVRFYYRRHKSGLVLWIREGAQVYSFIDRRRMLVANQLYRDSMNLREERLRAHGHP